MIEFKDFQKIDLRIGRIISAENLQMEYFTHKLEVNFGNLGQKISFINLKKYKTDDLIGKLVVGVFNIEPKKVPNGVSEVLLLGAEDPDKQCVLIEPDKKVELGTRVY